jgi:hypothetical protein
MMIAFCAYAVEIVERLEIGVAASALSHVLFGESRGAF